MNSYRENLRKGKPKKVSVLQTDSEEDELIYPLRKKSNLQVKFEKFKKRYSVRE